MPPHHRGSRAASRSPTRLPSSSKPSPPRASCTPWTAPWLSSASTPYIGDPLPATAGAPLLRQYTDDVEAVRILYFVTALRTVVVVAYIEV